MRAQDLQALREALVANAFVGRIAENEPLARYTSFRIGGPADLFLEPADKRSLVLALREIWSRGIPVFILGGGTNVLVSDAGFRGAVVSTRRALRFLCFKGVCAAADSGVKLPRFVLECAKRGLSGLEALCGVPGTVGGAVAMNAGAGGCQIADCLVSVEVLSKQWEVCTLSTEQLQLGYRTSVLLGGGFVVLKANFRFRQGDPDEIMRRVREAIDKRRASQPVNQWNAGCVFKNPPGDYAGRLIELCGAKGIREGGAQVSNKHANFIVNLGGATANDVRRLMKRVQDMVRDNFGIELEPELILVGEWE